MVRILPGESDAGGSRGIAASPDGKALAVGLLGDGLRIFDARTFEQLGKPLPFSPETLAYSPDGETLAIGGWVGYDGVGYLRLVDAHTQKQLAQVRLGKAQATRLAFTKDGAQLAVVESVHEGASWITIRDASTLRQIGARIEPRGFTGRWLSQLWTDPSIALTPDGRSLVTTSQVGELTWWDLESRKPTRTLQVAEGYRALGLSPDGASAAIGLDDGIQLIDLRTGAKRESVGTLGSEPDLAPVQPGRQDHRVDEPRRDGHRVGCRCADSPRDAAWALGLGLAAGLQPRWEDAVHDEHRRERDRLGPQPRAAV